MNTYFSFASKSLNYLIPKISNIQVDEKIDENYTEVDQKKDDESDDQLLQNEMIKKTTEKLNQFLHNTVVKYILT